MIPFTVLRPSPPVTSSWCGPGAAEAGTENTTCRSDQETIGTDSPSSVTRPVPWLAPKPWPLMANWRAAPASAASTYGRLTANSSGVTGALGWFGSLSRHAAGAFVVVPGSSIAIADGTGARSAGPLMPGQDSKKAPMVR